MASIHPWSHLRELTLTTCRHCGIHDEQEQAAVLNRVFANLTRARSKDISRSAMIDMIKAAFPSKERK